MDKLTDRLRRYSPDVIAYKLDADFAAAVEEACGSIDHLRELAQAEKDGRLVVLPVKPGTQVWSSVFCKVNEDGTESPTYPWNFDISMVKEWGQGWHLTREEAEAALKGSGKE